MLRINIYEKTDEYKGLPLLKELNNNELRQKIEEELAYHFHQEALSLFHHVVNLVKEDVGIALVLSDESGGFARYGYAVEEGNGVCVKETSPYIELVLSLERVEEGELKIFTHELGHVIMKMLIGDMSFKRNNKQHTSVGVTDFFTAFDEGFSIHFERLASDRCENYKSVRKGKYTAKNHSMSYWQCDADEEMRFHGMKDGRYMYRKAMVNAGLDLDSEKRIMMNHASPVFDKTNIKSGQELMSSEGFIAYLFYQLVNDVELSKYTFSSNSKYSLDRSLEGVSMVWRKMVNSMHHCSSTISGSQSPMINLIVSWAEIYPEDEQRIYEIFIRLTSGITIDHSNMSRVNLMSKIGMLGDAEGIRGCFKQQESLIKDYVMGVINKSIDLAGTLRDPLWVEVENTYVLSCYWDSSSSMPLVVDLHQADVEELEVYFKISNTSARHLIIERDRHLYKTLEEYENKVKELCNTIDI